ncbi:MAG TPA: lamin tail domain-containing protein, partial [Thermoguttaceae bacterium]|nr:lamin tail domain-containing protein [Thermoguttaceae bacterium]
FPEGSGYTVYKWRLDDGAWSDETPIDTPISLVGLADGPHWVDVVAKNDAQRYQDDPLLGDDAMITHSKTWTVDANMAMLPHVRINELLAGNVTAVPHNADPDAVTYPDMVELYNDGQAEIDLSGMSLTDDPAMKTKFVFAPGTTLGQGEYLVLYGGTDLVTPENHLGFNLNNNGDAIYLYDSAGNQVDSVTFGVQLDDMSIGRVGANAHWALTQPTFGSENVVQPTAEPAALSINEYLTDGDIRFSDDFIELYNPNFAPVALGGLALTDDPVAQPGRHVIAPLSFIAGQGYAVFTADQNTGAGANHLSFKLSPDYGLIGLYDQQLGEIDKLIYATQTSDVSEGRNPDGGEGFTFLTLPTPGIANSASQVTTTTPLVAIDASWKYNQTSAFYDTSWAQPGYADGSWPSGRAVLYVESSSLPATKITPLTLGRKTYYFRGHFNLDADPQDVQLKMTTLIDDGAIFYLNGHEVLDPRLGMAPGPVNYDTWTNRTVGNAGFEGAFDISTDYLVQGDNVLAVEVHQHDSGSTDIVFALTLDALVTSTVQSGPLAEGQRLLDGLRVTELMYNPEGDPELEYIELQNIGDEVLNLGGVRFTDGVDFVFPEMTLDPGQYVVVARNAEAFTARYGNGVLLAGQYTGALSDGGEAITLKLPEPLDAAIQRFTYNDAWYRVTDGAGMALVIVDAAGDLHAWDAKQGWTFAAPSPGADAVFGPTIVGRRVFYNNSTWDDPAHALTDDDAIARNKHALLPGDTATFDNYTSYVHGINGLIVDVARSPAPPTLDDFQFLVGNRSDTATWSAAPTPDSFTLHETPDFTRVTITWPDDAIVNQWLQVRVAADNLGLSADDVFYFGNAIGEAGNEIRNTIVNATDEILARNFQHSALDPAPIDDPYDYNRDGLVNGTDQIIARGNQTNALTMLRLITAPATNAAIEQAVQESPEAISAALDWQYEFESMQSKTAKRKDIEATVDLLLATDWR